VGEMVSKTNKNVGDSQLLGARARAAPQVYAYAHTVSKNIIIRIWIMDTYVWSCMLMVVLYTYIHTCILANIHKLHWPPL